MVKLKLKGEVIRTSGRTVYVSVLRAVMQKIGRIKRSRKKYAVDDPNGICKVGQTVSIVQCPRVSKTKCFCVDSIEIGI